MMYGWSVTHCLPTQMVEQPTAALGTALRADTVRELAAEAGFGRVEVLPVDNDFFRLYRLEPLKGDPAMPNPNHPTSQHQQQRTTTMQSTTTTTSHRPRRRLGRLLLAAAAVACALPGRPRRGSWRRPPTARSSTAPPRGRATTSA
jgi:hypothetical protein